MRVRLGPENFQRELVKAVGRSLAAGLGARLPLCFLVAVPLNMIGVPHVKTSIRPNRFRQLIRRGVFALGPNLQIPSPELVEIIGLAGFDFVMLDGEHGAAFSALPALLTASDAAGITSLVRVPSHQRSVLLPPLELGAGGVQVPFVNTAQQAQALVREVKFPPLGERGVSVITRAARFGFCNRQTYLRDANRETLLSVQLETREAAENAEAIAAVPGVDLVFIGPADLAQSLGHPAERITPPTIRVIENIIRRVAPIKPIGVSAFSAADAQRWQRAGATWILCSSAGPLKEAFVGHATMLRGAVTDPARRARV